MMNKQINHASFSAIDNWTPLQKPYHDYFNDSEIKKFEQCTLAYRDIKRTIAICVFENRFAALGGLSSVIKSYPKFLAESGERVSFFTPFHKNNEVIKKAVSEGIISKKFSLPYCSTGEFSGQITCYEQKDNGFISYYIDVDGFFNAKQNPYDYSNQSLLIDDAFAFSSAVPFVLNALSMKKNILIHAHDWETAPLAFSLKRALLCDVLESGKIVLTLHNSYDSPIPEGKMAYYFGQPNRKPTVLQECIQFLDGPVTTVSQIFAHELTNDPLQKNVFANHLQNDFSMNPPVGIDNGTFGTVSKKITTKELTEARNGNMTLLLKKKKKLRNELIKTCDTYNDERIIGKLEFNEDEKDAPVFFMSGRFDLMQKGFDLVFHAFSKLTGIKAKLIFTPSNSDFTAGKSFQFFSEIAGLQSGNITIWPFMLPERIYKTLISGASFAIMPSFYEPFGAVTEGFINGTPVVARGTGGLLSQVISHLPCKLPLHYDSFFGCFEKKLFKPNGILFRENVDSDNIDLEKEWKKIYSKVVGERSESKLYQAMVEAVMKAVTDSCSIYENDNLYASLILNGLDTTCRFDWAETVKEFKSVYNCVSRSKF